MVRESPSKEMMYKQRSKRKEGFRQECGSVCVCLVKDAFQIDPDVQIPDMEKLCPSFRNRINTSLPGANCNKLYHLTNPTKLPACKQLLSLLNTNKQIRRADILGTFPK